MYSISQALPTIKRIQLIDCKKFAAAALDPGKEAFVMHVNYFQAKMLIHPTQKAQIALLLAKEVTVPDEYLDLTDVFSNELVVELPERSDINEHVIDLELGK